MTPREALAELIGLLGGAWAEQRVATLRATIEAALDEPFDAYGGAVVPAEPPDMPPVVRGPACDGCLHGWPVVPCAVTGAPVHRGPDFSTDCRQPEPTDEGVERVARWLYSKFNGDPDWLDDWEHWLLDEDREDWRNVARAAIAALAPGRVPDR